MTSENAKKVETQNIGTISIEYSSDELDNTTTKSSKLDLFKNKFGASKTPTYISMNKINKHENKSKTLMELKPYITNNNNHSNNISRKMKITKLVRRKTEPIFQHNSESISEIKPILHESLDMKENAILKTNDSHLTLSKPPNLMNFESNKTTIYHDYNPDTTTPTPTPSLEINNSNNNNNNNNSLFKFDKDTIQNESQKLNDIHKLNILPSPLNIELSNATHSVSIMNDKEIKPKRKNIKAPRPTLTGNASQLEFGIIGGNPSFTLNHRKKIRWRIYACYCLLSLVYGCVRSMPSALFSEFQTQVSSSVAEISLIFTMRSIGFCVGTIITGYIIDICTKTHSFVSCTIIVTGISISILYYIKNVVTLYIVFVIIGFSSGIISTSIPVYLYRFVSLKYISIRLIKLLLNQ